MHIGTHGGGYALYSAIMFATRQAETTLNTRLNGIVPQPLQPQADVRPVANIFFARTSVNGPPDTSGGE